MIIENITGYKFALIDSEKVSPRKQPKVHHGSSDSSILENILKNGLPKKGVNLELLSHAEPHSDNNDSAFRGSTEQRQIASEFAGDGGVIYEIRDWPGYNLAELLDGKILRGVTYGDLKMSGECEIAIPAEVPNNYIKGYGLVYRSPNTNALRYKWSNYGI